MSKKRTIDQAGSHRTPFRARFGDDSSKQVPSMKGRLRLFARGLRRRISNATKLERMVREHIGRRRVALVPHPVFWSVLLVLFTSMGGCAALVAAAELIWGGILATAIVLGGAISLGGCGSYSGTNG